MSKKIIIITLLFILTNTCSALAGYQWYEYHARSQLKAFLGVDQKSDQAVPTPQQFFDITDATPPLEKKSHA